MKPCKFYVQSSFGHYISVPLIDYMYQLKCVRSDGKYKYRIIVNHDCFFHHCYIERF